MWFIKSRRASSVDDFETWIAGGVVPTLNAMDNTGESRATVLILFEPKSLFEENWSESKVKNALRANASKSSHILIFYGNRVDDIRIQGDVINTLQARMGTGGNNMPMILNDDEEPVVMRDREGKAGGGKGALISTTAFTLATSNFHTIFPDSATVRRLTPVECERLQGFPDGWTAQRYDEKKDAIIEQADSARYKQMGNAVAVPVVEWVIERMLAMIPEKTINDINKENVESNFSSTDEDAQPLTPTQKAGQ
jgi:DNA (cytosine-5)-methyltransferase 1